MKSAPRAWLLGLDHLWNIRHRQLDFYHEVQSRHGDACCLRLGPYRSWLLFHPEHIQPVLVKHARSFVRFEPTMRVLSQWNGASVLIAEGASWQAQRSSVLPAFGLSRMPDYAASMQQHTHALRAEWLALARREPDAVIDIDAAMVALTLDLATTTLFSSGLGAAREAIAAAVAALSGIAFREALQVFPTPAFLPTAHQREKRRAVSVLRGAVADIVKRRQGSADNGDVLSCLLKQDMTEAQLCDEVTTLLIAGHETTSAALTWTLYLLAMNPQCCEQLQQELDEVLQGRAPSLETMRRLPYLDAVIKESLRLYPPAYSLFLRRATQDADLGEIVIRKGEMVQIVPYITQRDERWFADAGRFMPERFLEKEASWPRHAFLPFGAGPRVCLGQAFGMMEVCLIAATLLQAFTPVGDMRQVRPLANFSLRPDGGMPLKMVPRSFFA